MNWSIKSAAVTYIIGTLLLPGPLNAQSSLSDQQRRCDELRSEVDDARRELDSQSSRADTAGETDEMIISAMRAKGRSEAMIEQYKRTSKMQRSWSGTESNARRRHLAAVERYQLQGCSTGGHSTYNYDVQ